MDHEWKEGMSEEEAQVYHQSSFLILILSTIEILSISSIKCNNIKNILNVESGLYTKINLFS
jgi:hypothetical protein